MSTVVAVNTRVDIVELESRVKQMYRDVAQNPDGDFHFEMGRQMAERLGYPADILDQVPAQAIASFAGVGYYFHLAGLQAGESVIDLGSGSGMDSFFAAISNGVVNLAADKASVFREAFRLLKPGGRLAIADIVTEVPLPEGITCDATLWAACIGGALQIDDYLQAIKAAGLVIKAVEDNPHYRFVSDNARGATETWGVKSVSILAQKPV